MPDCGFYRTRSTIQGCCLFLTFFQFRTGSAVAVTYAVLSSIPGLVGTNISLSFCLLSVCAFVYHLGSPDVILCG